MMNEDQIDTYYYFASATFYAYAGSIPPILTVSYRNNTGIEPYYTYRTMSAGEAGTAYVADATGQLKIVKELVSYASACNPFSLNLVYNSDYFSSSDAAYDPVTQLGLSMSVGSGWTLDCIQKITAETISGTAYLKYVDGDGTVHYFRKDSSRDANFYYDEDGLGLKIKNTGTNTYTMSDDNGNEWIFTGSFLTSAKDSDGNAININYSSGKITTITQVNKSQSAITVATFTYSGNTLVGVTDAAGKYYSLIHSGTKLTGIGRNGTTIAEYMYWYDAARVNQMVDTESSYRFLISYLNGKVSSIQESVGIPAGSGTYYSTRTILAVSYPAHSETVYRDNGINNGLLSDDIITHYLFDYTGRTVNVYTTDVDGYILGASNAVYTTSTGTVKDVNRIEKTATIGVPAQQLMRNPGFEAENTTWGMSSGVSIATTKPRSGAKGLKITNASSTNQYAICSSEILTNATYTLSCFVNTSAVTSFSGIGVYLRVSDPYGRTYDSQPVKYATSSAIDGGWVRISVTFMALYNGMHDIILFGQGVGGTIYADDFQLEKAEAPSSFNLLENGSMEMVNYSWNLGTNANFVSGSGLGVSNTNGCIRVVGDPQQSGTNAWQEITLNLPVSQTYVLSGWAKANAVPDDPAELNSPDDVTKKCGLRATITYSDGTTEGHYVPFNSDISEWQFTSMTIVPKKTSGTVSKIRVTLAYEGNANICFFDNISLLREVAQTMKYDADGNLESVTTSGLNKDTNSYANGNLMRTITSGNGTFDFTYDSTFTHRLKSVTNGLITQSLGYDTTGNVTTTTLSGNNSKSIQTSAAFTGNGNRVSSVTDAAGNSVSYVYGTTDAQMRSQPTSVTAPNGTVTTSAYDASGRVTQTGIANTASLQYNYSSGNLSSVQRTAGSSTQTYGFTYDAFGNMLTAKVGSRTLATNVYTNFGPLARQTYGNGDITRFTYDNLGRVKTATYDDGRVLTYVYNGEGQLHSLTEVNGSNTTTYLYTYDSIGRLIYSEQLENGTSVLRTSQTYNANNQLTGQAWQMGSTAYSETYTYNSTDGSLNKMTTGAGTTLTMGYDALRRLTSVTGGPVSRQYTYRDINSSKTTLQVASVTSGGQQYQYTYDAMGNIASCTMPGGEVIAYTYDNQGQLLKAQGNTTYTYTYNGAGNILTASNGTTTHSYTYGNTDWKDLLTAFDGNSITYDAIGNPTSYYNGARWTFGWENGRQLTTASKTGTSLSFAYDASGLRTKKVADNTTYRYYYAGGKLMRQTWGSNTIDFFYDANGTPYAMKYNGTLYYYITNLQGDVMRIVNASGTVAASYEYDPYGKVISATGTLANTNPLRYRGYVYDTETGFYYLQSRYYDPAIGRFINADAFASTGQGILGCNMFAYCGNNPAMYVDLHGTDAVVLFDRDILGHIGALIQDSDGAWYHYYWGTPEDNIIRGLSLLGLKVPHLTWCVLYEGDLNLESINSTKQFKGEYEEMTYLKGDFSESLAEAQRYAAQYSLYTNNCTEVTFRILSHSQTIYSQLLSDTSEFFIPGLAYQLFVKCLELWTHSLSAQK